MSDTPGDERGRADGNKAPRVSEDGDSHPGDARGGRTGRLARARPPVSRAERGGRGAACTAGGKITGLGSAAELSTASHCSCKLYVRCLRLRKLSEPAGSLSTPWARRT